MAVKSPKHGLSQHVRGAWYRSINGRWTLVAGKREAPTPEAADAVYESKMSDLWRGKPSPRSPATVDATLKQLADVFIDAKRHQLKADNLAKRTFDEYVSALKDLADVLGRSTPFREITARDFTAVHQQWAARFGPHRLSKYISIVRSVCNWLKANGYLAEVPSYGDFVQPTRAQFRRHLAEKEERGAKTTFSADEIARLLNKADITQRAQVLLGINCGFGNSDLSNLRVAVCDLAGGWIDYRRGKTGVKRRCPLWPETIAALRAAIPKSKITGNVFSTYDGRPLVQGTKDRLAARFKTLGDDANCYLEGRGFYALRHTFATAAIAHGPSILVRRMTGHTSDQDDRLLDEAYIGRVDDKLCEMADGVRRTLLVKWSKAQLATPLAAAPKPHDPSESTSQRKGMTRSNGAKTRSRGRTARRGSSPGVEAAAA